MIQEPTVSKRVLECKNNIYDLDNQIERNRKTLVTTDNSHAEFWKLAAEIAELQASKVKLRRQILLSEVIDNGGEQSEWESSEESRNMLIKAYAMEEQRKLYNQQAERLSISSCDDESGPPRGYLHLFTASKLSLETKYLYYHYCIQFLRRAWNKEIQDESQVSELMNWFWGMPGEHIRKNIMRMLVEELGPGYEQLLKGATNEQSESSESDPTFLIVAFKQIKYSLRTILIPRRKKTLEDSSSIIDY